MLLKIILTVCWWIYALAVIIASIFFVKDAPLDKDYRQDRKIVAIIVDELIIGIGILLTIMIWKN